MLRRVAARASLSGDTKGLAMPVLVAVSYAVGFDIGTRAVASPDARMSSVRQPDSADVIASQAVDERFAEGNRSNVC